MGQSCKNRLLGGLACIAAASLAANPAWAQPCPAGPFPGTIDLSAAPPVTFICQEGLAHIGDNLIEIHAFSPVNQNPANPFTNGFQQLCQIFGLVGTTSEILQVDAQAGMISVFICDQIAAPPFQPCQGVLIRPAMNAAGIIPVDHVVVPPDFEGTWTYTSHPDGLGALGDNLFGVPHTADLAIPPTLNPEDLCGNLNLPAGAMVTRIDACLGWVYSHLCGSIPVFNLVPNEAVLIRTPVAANGIVPIP